jgi:hypothetical protein
MSTAGKKATTGKKATSGKGNAMSKANATVGTKKVKKGDTVNMENTLCKKKESFEQTVHPNSTPNPILYKELTGGPIRTGVGGTKTEPPMEMAEAMEILKFFTGLGWREYQDAMIADHLMVQRPDLFKTRIDCTNPAKIKQLYADGVKHLKANGRDEEIALLDMALANRRSKFAGMKTMKEYGA